MKQPEIKEKVMRFITRYRQVAEVSFICKALNLKHGQVRKALQSLRSEGVVIRTSKQYDKWVVKQLA